MNEKNGEDKKQLEEVLPQEGFVEFEDQANLLICKPKLLPIKSKCFEKMENLKMKSEMEIRKQKEEKNKENLENLNEENENLRKVDEEKKHVDRLIL